MSKRPRSQSLLKGFCRDESFREGAFFIFIACLIMMIGCEQPKAPTVSQTSNTSYTFERGFPSNDAAQKAIDDTDFQRTVQAYRFWYPTVSNEGIFQGNRDTGVNDNVNGGYLAATPRQVGFTLNSDTPYASATLDTSKGPIAIEVPAGAYIGLVNDHNQTWVADLGIPGPNGGKRRQDRRPPTGFQGHTACGVQTVSLRYLQTIDCCARSSCGWRSAGCASLAHKDQDLSR